MSDTYVTRQFRITSDAALGFRPIDAICQFDYRGYQISMSTAGMSQGSCQHLIEIFHDDASVQTIGPGFRTVEDAINFINKMTREYS